MEAQELIREFKYNSVTLADPGPTLSLQQVREFYSAVYPELVNAEIEGPTVSGNRNVYAFRRAVGTKGSPILTPAEAVALLKERGTLRARNHRPELTKAALNQAPARALATLNHHTRQHSASTILPPAPQVALLP